MHNQFAIPPLLTAAGSELDAHPSSGSAAPSQSDPESNHEGPGRTLGSSGFDFEEQDRQRAARYFVNAAADALLARALGALCKPATCIACGITFLAMSATDATCHVCVSESVR